MIPKGVFIIEKELSVLEKHDVEFVCCNLRKHMCCISTKY